MHKEIELTPYLESLLLKDIEARNKAQADFDTHLKIVFESKGVEMPDGSFNVRIEKGKLYY